MKTIQMIVNGLCVSMYRHHHRKEKIRKLFLLENKQ
jgi:hypothetical protein